MGLGLYEIMIIIVALVLVGACAVLLALVYVLWPQIWQFLKAAQRRYLRISWPEFVSHFADDDGDDMSSEGGSGEHVAGSGTGSGGLVLPQQNQANQEPVRDFSQAVDFLVRHNPTDEELIDILTVLRRSDGDYLLSANKIRDIVGGSDAAVKARVAKRRPKKAPALKPSTLYRPRNGW